jgi:hypothetical protein
MLTSKESWNSPFKHIFRGPKINIESLQRFNDEVCLFHRIYDTGSLKDVLDVVFHVQCHGDESAAHLSSDINLNEANVEID